ncbi:SGNH/GDSL hydrolase family protein [Lapidilactobacillus bayanensis]|uniref:SGNH/GDSL hydrolase family protein n=1 Tax=Lapidilactobacillus bayanensis TaxID=2485998 RepID=UPI000F7B2320|nr:SGNH/GDSL hydrolase family protein [Lapidilactobacillus bayanensis]
MSGWDAKNGILAFFEEDIMDIQQGIIAVGNQLQLQLRLKCSHELTIGFIGGSITNGTGASASQNSYVSMFENWVSTVNPNCRVINAGIGGTDSEYGSLRLKRDFPELPDIMIVEFSVNDKRACNEESFETLLQKLIICGVQPIVLENFRYFTTESYGSIHTKIASKYAVPILNVQSIFSQEELANEVLMHRYSEDGLHPIDVGHDLVFKLMKQFFMISENYLGGSYNRVLIPAKELKTKTDTNVQVISLMDYKFRDGILIGDLGKSFEWNGVTSYLGIQYRRTKGDNPFYLELIIKYGNKSQSYELFVDHSDSHGDLLMISDLWEAKQLIEVSVTGFLRSKGSKVGNPIYLSGLIVNGKV